MRLLLRIASPALAFMVGAVASAQTEPPPPPPYPPAPGYEGPPPQDDATMGSLTLPPGATLSGAQSAVFAALRHRGWQVLSSSGATIEARLLRRHLDTVLTIRLDPSQVQIDARSYEIGRSGEERDVPFTHTNWIRYLEEDIRSYAARRPQG